MRGPRTLAASSSGFRRCRRNPLLLRTIPSHSDQSPHFSPCCVGRAGDWRCGLAQPVVATITPAQTPLHSRPGNHRGGGLSGIVTPAAGGDVTAARGRHTRSTSGLERGRAGFAPQGRKGLGMATIPSRVPHHISLSDLFYG